VVLRAAEWTSKSDNRTAVFTIHVGTADTSEASAEIAVVQLRVDDYYYLYGASVGASADAISATVPPAAST